MKTYVLSFLLFCRRGYPPNADDERARSPQRPRPASWREREKSEHIHQVTASVQEKLAESSLAQLDAFLANFEPKFQMLLQAIQSPVVELVRSSTQQLNDSLAGLRENINSQYSESAKVSASILLTREMIEEVNQEVSKFIAQRETTVNSAKEFHRQLLASLGELKLPCIQGFIRKFIAPPSRQNTILCSRCNVFVAKSKQSLGAHQKTCKGK